MKITMDIGTIFVDADKDNQEELFYKFKPSDKFDELVKKAYQVDCKSQKELEDEVNQIIGRWLDARTG